VNRTRQIHKVKIEIVSELFIDTPIKNTVVLMKRHFVRLFAGSFVAVLMAVSAMAQMPKEKLEELAASMAARLTTACPRAATRDVAAHTARSKALRAMTDPVGRGSGLGRRSARPAGGQEASHEFRPRYFPRTLHVAFWFDGTWSVSHDDRDDIDVIHAGTFFRNKLPPDESPARSGTAPTNGRPTSKPTNSNSAWFRICRFRVTRARQVAGP
jgi:hypothetical protein